MTRSLLQRLADLPGVEQAPSQFNGSPALWIDGREFVVPDDIKVLAVDSLAHRVVPAAGLRLERGRAREIVKAIVTEISVPVTGPTS